MADQFKVPLHAHRRPLAPRTVVLVGDPTFPDCSIVCRALGMFVMTDEIGLDEKVPCVPAHDPRRAPLQDIGDVREFDLLEIAHFFEVYKDLEPGKSVEGSHWANHEQAYAEIRLPAGRAGPRLEPGPPHMATE